MTDAEGTICRIRSTHDQDGRAACLMQWGSQTTLLHPDVVMATAQDLLAAAAAAEADIALIRTLRQDLDVDDQTLGGLLTAVRQRRAQPPAKIALRISAVAGAKTGRAFVTIARGSMKGQLSAGEARDMAVAWIQTATAAHIDVRLRYALGEWDHLSPEDIERLFTLIQAVQR